MRAFLSWLAVLIVAFAALPVWASADPPQSFRVLCYHDIRDNLRESFTTWPEPTALDTRDLVRHFSWLQENGYQPVSLREIADARAGRGMLPEKAVLLTFDDGYKSVYTKVFPLLKQFNFPAVIALVGEWMDAPEDAHVRYGDALVSRKEFVSWAEVREMLASGLVEVASHSHGMHKGIAANPQGNTIASAISRYYRPEAARYEDDVEYETRIKNDLKQSAELVQRETGVRPAVMVWPYGAYSLLTARWAAEAGMPMTMNLEPGPNTTEDSLQRIRRGLVMYNTGLVELAKLLDQPAAYSGVEHPRERIVHVDLDYVYDADPNRQEANLSALLDRIVRLRPTTVYLQAYADPDGDGVASAVYFPNRHLPMRADLFSRVSWQLRTRASVKVFAWMPVLAYSLPPEHPAANALVRTMPGAPQAASEGRYHRLSPFDALARKTIAEIYADLGKHAVFAGVLFHDDATLSDFEDASPAALRVYEEQWQLPASVDAIREDRVSRQRWSERKTAYLNAFTGELASVLREYHPALLTARNLYAQPVLDPQSEEWFAQSLQSFTESYDFVAVMAMPYMEGADDPEQWLTRLIEKVKSTPGAVEKTVFELQSRNWKNDDPIPAETLASHWRILHRGGALHWGYYPDDFHRNQPDENVIRAVISVQTFPARR